MILKDLRIITKDKDISHGYLVFDDGVIKEVGEGDCPYENAVSKEGLICLPGFIDIHVHGSAGIDFMKAHEKDYEIVAQSLYEEGVTTFLATTMTSDFNSLKNVCETVRAVKDQIPSLGGIHLEGPYISKIYKGAQNPDYIRQPSVEEFNELQSASGNNIRYITLAPELDGAMDFIRQIASPNVHISAGHTNATFKEVQQAIIEGLTHITHTYNAQSPHHHRHPGVVTAALYCDKLNCEFICDGIHVLPEVIKTSLKCIGPERFIAITDALSAKHAPIKSFTLGGFPCTVRDNAAYLEDGTLAGSMLTMDKALRNLRDFTGETLISLAKMTSSNAARSLGFVDRGIIESGLLADFVLLDESLFIREVYKQGLRVK